MLHKYRHFLSIALIIILVGCGKKDNPVPLTSINYVIYNVESDSRYSNLRVSGGSEYLKAGNICVGYNCNGVVLYRMKTTDETDDFRAYDRTCPYEANDCSMVIDEHWSYILRCPQCGSEFNMEGGFMEKGPAYYPLREFDCDFYNGDLRLY